MGTHQETFSVNALILYFVIKYHSNYDLASMHLCLLLFSNINGTSAQNFEGHIAEIMWRNHNAKISRHVAFYDMVKQYHPLHTAPHFTHSRPLFQWDTADMTLVSVEDRKYVNMKVLYNECTKNALTFNIKCLYNYKFFYS